MSELLRAVFKAGGSAQAALDKLTNAFGELYHAKQFSDTDRDIAVYAWRLGGPRLLKALHVQCGFPAISILMSRAQLPRFQVFCGSFLDLTILRHNIESMMAGKGNLLRILMMDEVAIEGKIDVDHQGNVFLGTCFEHSGMVKMIFDDESD